MLSPIRSRSVHDSAGKVESGRQHQGEGVGTPPTSSFAWGATPETREEETVKAERAAATARAASKAEVGVQARTGGVILDDVSNTPASGARHRVVLNDRIIAPGQWKDGKILLSRTSIREVAAETGDSVRRILYDTAYHESFHGLVEPIAKLVSKWLGMDDIYDASYQAMLRGEGRGWWYRAEEAGAEFFGRLRGYLRDRWGLR
jgi:hypothetical protein